MTAISSQAGLATFRQPTHALAGATAPDEVLNHRDVWLAMEDCRDFAVIGNTTPDAIADQRIQGAVGRLDFATARIYAAARTQLAAGMETDS